MRRADGASEVCGWGKWACGWSKKGVCVGQVRRVGGASRCVGGASKMCGWDKWLGRDSPHLHPTHLGLVSEEVHVV